MIDKIYNLFIKFSLKERLEGNEITGIKFYPGSTEEWVIENNSTLVGVTHSGEGIEDCLQFLTSRVNSLGIANKSRIQEVYDLWKVYYPIHQALCPCEDCYPCLIFTHDGEVIIEDQQSETDCIDCGGTIEEAIAILSKCIVSRMSFIQLAEHA